MCSGGPNEMNNDPAPRPAQKPQRPERAKTPSWNAYPSSAASSSKQHTYAPPSGPPPSQHQYAAPPGPPPSHRQNEFAPPAGPPPDHKPGYALPPSNQDWAVPPPEAPPSQKTAEHDWQAAVPDTSLFPPPPAIFSGHDYSPTNNATEEEAEAGEAWSVGFTALPYPSFRLPGWHRGSLAVHSDDGRKYINDRWGGKDFTHAFRKGETLGIGMTFAPTGTPRPDVSVFFTRDGVRAGGWDLHEETDAKQDLPVTGLEGFHDLTCAIGVFDSADIEVVFDPAKWKYKPT
ncbi:hypothetical protein H633G_04855 [Metarhizium anisopliae BRIP 53284]|nr:hypothetical protein H633G_04855 [Metarhizium anisopliae BRIP 53284]